MIEVSKEYILKLEKGSIYYIFNPLTNTYKQEEVGKNDIAHNKHAYEGLKYYIKEML